MPSASIDPHADEPVITTGPPLQESGRAVVMIHGRNAAPRNILDLVPRLARPSFTYLAPAAASNTWYPFSFLEPVAKNEPFLTSAIGRIHRLLSDVEASGVPPERIVLLGFSQGACLAAEYGFRHARRFGGLILFSGGLIGAPGTTWTSSASLFHTPVFLGCSDADPHVPRWRVDETAEVFQRMRGEVVKRIYPQMGHLVNEDEIVVAQSLLDRVE